VARRAAATDVAGGSREVSMSESRVLTPSEAQAVVDDRIEQFGLGALPRIGVAALDDGHWRVSWEFHEHVVAPMARDAWRAWLVEHVGPLDAADLETSES
jgi:hypothetical protein